MARKEFESWIVGQFAHMSSSEIKHGEIEELPHEKDPLLYARSTHRDRPYLLIIGHRVSEWRQKGAIKVCNLDTIEDEEDQGKAALDVLHHMKDRDVYIASNIVFHK